jgi:glycosyltransferase involved in cell wall biosynthesis
MAIVLGAYLSHERIEQAKSGKRPRIDVVELSLKLGIPLYGFDWLEQCVKRDRLTGRLMKVYRNQSDLLALRAFSALQNTDVVYATGEDVGLPLAMLLLLKRKKRPILIMRLEQPTYGRTPLRRWIYKAYFRLAMKRINLMMCRTQAHVKLLRSWGASEKQLSFVPETTDSAFFNPESQKESLESFKLPSQPYIVSAGLEMRDYDTLIEAVDGLPLHIVIGAGSPWSKFRYDRPDESLPENVTVSSYTPPQMRELYRLAELVVVPVIPTLRACGMNVVLEAWAMQKPVIASRTAGLASYIDDGQTGLFVEPRNAEALRGKISYALSHPEEARVWGLNGWQRINTELNLDRYLNEITTAADSLMD